MIGGFMDSIGDLEEKIIEESQKVFADECSTTDDQVMEILLNTQEQGQMMEQLIKNQIEVKDNLIDKLHKELEYYKQDSASKFVDQLMKAVIKIRKDVGRIISSNNWDELTADELRREYTYIFEDLTDLLEQQNVDAYSTDPGELFDASIHQPKTELTDDASLDKKIKQSLGDGYKKGDKVLIPERVVVYQYRA